MKNIAKLVLFLSISFIGLLLFSSLISILSGWIGKVLLFPPDTGNIGIFSGEIGNFLGSSVLITFYFSILLGLNYAARRRIAYPVAFIFILVFVLVLSGAAFFGLESLDKTGFDIAVKKTPALQVKPGYILNQGTLSGYQTVFLEDPNKPDAAVVIMVQGQALNYQNRGAHFTRTKLPFFTEKRGIFHNISSDFEQSAQIFTKWFNNGLWSYGVYAGSLAVFLLSLGCIVNISFWSLANLFFGALAFRGVLALENFLNQGNIHELLSSFTGKMIHPSLINPIIFLFLSLLILLYSGLVYLARGRIDND